MRGRSAPRLDAGLRRLRLDEIESFLVLADELHFGRAAERLFLSPGALSRRIAHLERALGAQLLERTTRSVAITPYGRRFAAHAREALAALTAAGGRQGDAVCAYAAAPCADSSPSSP